MCDYENKDKIKTMPCLHNFHDNCIKLWLDKNSTCPVCKHDIRENFSHW